jgi:hypothetical protein
MFSMHYHYNVWKELGSIVEDFVVSDLPLGGVVLGLYIAITVFTLPLGRCYETSPICCASKHYVTGNP